MDPAGGLLGTWSLLSSSSPHNQLPMSGGLGDKSLFLPALEAMCSDSEKALSAVCPQACGVKCPLLVSLQTPWPYDNFNSDTEDHPMRMGTPMAGTPYEDDRLLPRSLQGPRGLSLNACERQLEGTIWGDRQRAKAQPHSLPGK